MNTNLFSSLNLRTVILLFLVSSGTIYTAACSSTDLPTESSIVPSSVSETVFEAVVEYDAGENPLGITFGDFNGDNKQDIVVTSPRKQDGLLTTADGSKNPVNNKNHYSRTFSGTYPTRTYPTGTYTTRTSLLVSY